MEKILLKNVEIDNTLIEYLYLYLDNDGNLIFLPFLWLVHLGATKSHYIWKTKSITKNYLSFNESIERTCEPIDLSDNTIKNYVGHFYHFLQYVEETKSKEFTVHNLERVTDRYINTYLNSILPKQIRSSKALHAHQAAINSFYNFLNYLEIRTAPITRIFPKTKKYLASRDDRPKKISYISRENRHYLLSECTSKRDRLILRMGFEVGLRTSECIGLGLNDVKYKNNIQLGLISLFKELERDERAMSFSYLLLGKYTKRGRTRRIYFDRELLTSMKDYFETERKFIINRSHNSCDTLFVRNDPEGFGLSINRKHASNLFTKLRKSIPHLNQILSYHDLRHTFATELYHSELRTRTGRETRSESAALLVVSRRLGHKDASYSTKLYIRLQHQLNALRQLENYA